jgi:hypothetical protein
MQLALIEGTSGTITYTDDAFPTLTRHHVNLTETIISRHYGDRARFDVLPFEARVPHVPVDDRVFGGDPWRVPEQWNF